MKSKIVTASLFFLALVLTYYSTDLYLKSNFYEKGEAYMKGAGHLLREDFGKGLVFIVARNFFPTFFLFGLLFILTSGSCRKSLSTLLIVMSLVTAGLTLIYVFVKFLDIVNNQYYDQQTRLIEIALTWLLRVAGFYTACWLTNKSRRKHEAVQDISQQVVA